VQRQRLQQAQGALQGVPQDTEQGEPRQGMHPDAFGMRMAKLSDIVADCKETPVAVRSNPAPFFQRLPCMSFICLLVFFFRRPLLTFFSSSPIRHLTFFLCPSRSLLPIQGGDYHIGDDKSMTKQIMPNKLQILVSSHTQWERNVCAGLRNNTDSNDDQMSRPWLTLRP
jgi:hypothetical protein